MNKSIKILFVVLPLLLAGSGYGHTLRFNNFTTNVVFLAVSYNVPIGVTVIELSPWFVAYWNDEIPLNRIDLNNDWVVNCLYVGWWSIEELTPDSSIQDAFDQGLYLAGGIVGVLLAFSIIRTIPGGGHEEI